MLAGCGDSSGSSIAEEEKDPIMQPIDNFLNAFVKADGEKFMKCIYTKEALAGYFEGYDKDEIEDYYDGMSMVLENNLEDWEDDYGKKVKLSFTETDRSVIDEESLEDYEKYYSAYYEVDITVKTAYKVDGTFIIKGADDNTEEELGCIVVEIEDDGWYLYPKSELVEKYF